MRWKRESYLFTKKFAGQSVWPGWFTLCPSLTGIVKLEWSWYHFCPWLNYSKCSARQVTPNNRETSSSTSCGYLLEDYTGIDNNQFTSWFSLLNELWNCRWVKKNDYCFYAYLPYAMSFLVLEPEKDRAWSTRRVVNNYMMIAHTILMLEAIRKARDIPTWSCYTLFVNFLIK